MRFPDSDIKHRCSFLLFDYIFNKDDNFLITMGNEQKSTGRLDPQLDLHSEVEHPIYGPIPIYSSKALPMTFIMRLERITIHSRLYNLFQQIQDKQSPCMLTLYGFKLQRQQKGCSNCSPGDRTIEYWQYLNYTLKDHILDRAQRKVSFTYHQLWHIIQVIIEAIRLTLRVGLIWDLHPSLLEITPEGKLKANWSHLQLDNKHLKFYRGTETCWLSPEERWALKNKDESINFIQSNIYKLGLILLSLTNLTIEPILNRQTWSEVLNCQHSLIPRIADRCLDPQPRSRITIDQLYQLCEEHFNSAYQLLISQGRRQDLQQLQVRAQMLAASQNRSSVNFSELREGSRYYESVPFNFNYRQSKVSHIQSSYDHRLETLKEYRRNLVQNRNQR